jgi:hypothetical protein
MNQTPPGDLLLRPGVDRVVNLLRSRHRRRILLGLAAGRIDSEADVATRRPDEEDVESELLSTHLPMLEEEGIIEWDRETGEIKKGPNFDEIEPILQLLQKHDDELPPFWP